MEIYSSTTDEFGENQLLHERRYDMEQWQRWDEELVEEFGRWLTRIGKALAILLVVVFLTAILGWF